jgi:hypothetical protein
MNDAVEMEFSKVCDEELIPGTVSLKIPRHVLTGLCPEE